MDLTINGLDSLDDLKNKVDQLSAKLDAYFQLEEQNKILSITETAKYLGVGRDLVKRKIENGELPAVNFGSEEKAIYRISIKAIEKMMIENKGEFR